MSSKEWYQANREKVRQHQKEYRERNKELLKQRQAEYYQEHKEHLKSESAKHYWEKVASGQTLWHQALRVKVLEALGGKCIACGFSDFRALHIDHVNGGGRKERGTYGSNMYKYYQYILENIDSGKYQVLCANCNAIKVFEEKEHQKALDLRKSKEE